MNYENFKQGFNKPTIITGEQYGTKVSVEVDHSDIDIDQLMDAFETITIGLGYHKDSWKQWIIDRADEYHAEEVETIFDIEEDEFENLRHGYEDREELEDEFFGRYRATEEDESEFDDYGMRIPEDRVTFEWGDEPEDDSNLFEGDEWEANENLKAANERYKREVKKMNAKQKRTK